LEASCRLLAHGKFSGIPLAGKSCCSAITKLVGPVGRLRTSVADPGCLSRFPDPDFYPSRILDPDLGSRTRISDPGPGSQIPDPKTAAKERDEKNLVVIPFFVATNFTTLKIILFLKC